MVSTSSVYRKREQGKTLGDWSTNSSVENAQHFSMVFKTKAAEDKARLKYLKKEIGRIGLSVVRITA
jgi:hypothetical protein